MLHAKMFEPKLPLQSLFDVESNKAKIRDFGYIKFWIKHSMTYINLLKLKIGIQFPFTMIQPNIITPK